jgi:hypothetical protein
MSTTTTPTTHNHYCTSLPKHAPSRIAFGSFRFTTVPFHTDMASPSTVRARLAAARSERPAWEQRDDAMLAELEELMDAAAEAAQPAAADAAEERAIALAIPSPQQRAFLFASNRRDTADLFGSDDEEDVDVEELFGSDDEMGDDDQNTGDANADAMNNNDGDPQPMPHGVLVALQVAGGLDAGVLGAAVGGPARPPVRFPSGQRTAFGHLLRAAEAATAATNMRIAPECVELVLRHIVELAGESLVQRGVFALPGHFSIRFNRAAHLTQAAGRPFQPGTKKVVQRTTNGARPKTTAEYFSVQPCRHFKRSVQINSENRQATARPNNFEAVLPYPACRPCDMLYYKLAQEPEIYDHFFHTHNVTVTNGMLKQIVLSYTYGLDTELPPATRVAILWTRVRLGITGH